MKPRDASVHHKDCQIDRVRKKGIFLSSGNKDSFAFYASRLSVGEDPILLQIGLIFVQLTVRGMEPDANRWLDHLINMCTGEFGESEALFSLLMYLAPLLLRSVPVILSICTFH